ncbi:uncharacterized protein DUF3618 [Micromonospora sp. M71_S20]|uniref:DUF3618 domain-containing protein n=1 Tax=Micromonospora sp. M71_S20 TaxID=592872 RepID=UPI000EB33E66|nr:DUF3618 domain-containing protein [Micromonospora sp. M71_S20]RLK08758.1 uncharacterized protein DUF3618 [Micromonospora sp. M71_S20]
MSNDPERIRREIENTRNELSSDVDALADKVNPRRIAGERVGQARGALTRAKEKVMGVQSDGHGVAQRMSHATGQRMSHAADSARGLGEQSRDQMSHMADSARSFGEQSREQVSHVAGSVREEARSLGQQSRQQARGNPLAAGLIAFGTGLLISSLIPPSRPERRWAGQAKEMVSEHSDQLRAQAGHLREQATEVGREMGRGMGHNLREPAQEAARAVGSTAVSGASAIRDEGRSAAHQMQGQAHEAADDLRRR